jgi:hypothetical protein
VRVTKVPVTVEAIPTREALEAAQSSWKDLPQWLVDEYDKGNIIFQPSGVLITTLEGTMLASPDDWIIRGVKGEVYPCKPDIFVQTYEPEGRQWRWLSSTVELQAEHGYEMPLEDVTLTTYIEWNTLALFAEVGEALREVDWKPWSKGLGRVNRDALVEELVDCMHFIGNILTAVGVSDEELWKAYQAKQQVNFDRVRDGYTARLGS